MGVKRPSSYCVLWRFDRINHIVSTVNMFGFFLPVMTDMKRPDLFNSVQRVHTNSYTIYYNIMIIP